LRRTRLFVFLLVLIFLKSALAQSGGSFAASSMQLTKNPVKIWADEIAKADSVIQIAVYKFSSSAAMDALLAARKRGVRIEMIADGKAADGKKSLVSDAIDAGIQTDLWPTDELGELHVKLTIIDHSTIISGSFNLSEAAETENTELITIDRDPATAAAAKDIWNRLVQTVGDATH
jgi:phosphatidylserine/phosphatidylglycerophosphate/cardiolipin synthase-like enzyme